MHKIYLSILLLLIGTLSNLSAQITFEKTYGGAKEDRAVYVKPTFDGGYFIAGSANSFNTSNRDAYLIKTDANGDTVWTKTYGSSKEESIFSATQTKDSSFVICGSNPGLPGSVAVDVYLLKIDANGDSVWTKSLGRVPKIKLEAYSIRQTADEGFIITGYVDTLVNSGGRNIVLIKTDLDGNAKWTKMIVVEDHQSGYDVCQTFDRGYAIISSTPILPFNGSDGLIIKVDSNGDHLWSKTFNVLSNDDSPRSIQQTADSGFIITGFTDVLSASDNDVSLIKLNATGDLEWAKIYGGNQVDLGVHVQQTSDGGYVIAGNTRSFNPDNTYAYLIKTDMAGSVLWSKIYGKNASTWATFVQQTSDSAYIVAGVSYYSFGGLYDALLIKTDVNGNTCNSRNAATFTNNYLLNMDSFNVVIIPLNIITTTPSSTFIKSGGIVGNACPLVGINETKPNNNFLIYPNPSTGVFSIELPNEIESGKVEVFHINGQQVHSELVTHTSKQTIELSNIAEGIYFVKLFDGEGYSISRLVVAGQ